MISKDIQGTILKNFVIYITHVARILSPFLKFTDEVNKPYARLVAAELWDTFRSLFYPNIDPLDVKKSKSLLTSEKSFQIWNEFRLYSPDSKCKE